MTDTIPYLIESASSLYLGYSIGRHRHGERLTDWADNVLTTGIRKSWRYPPAAAIALITVGLLWTFRPRRTLANYRSWKDTPDHAELPAPTTPRTPPVRPGAP